MLQSFWAICSQDDFRMDEGEFRKEKFFYAIIELFEGEDADEEWAKETLAWWTQ
jgi:hypothetical protein